MSDVAERWVTQPTFNGCLPACIASVLGIPIRDAPTVRFDLGPEAWWEPYVDACVEQIGVELMSLDLSAPPRGLWIAVVPSRNRDEGGHAIVMRGSDVVWDPASSNSYEAVEWSDINLCIVLVPLDPMREVGRA